MSSRNAYLSPAERAAAPALFRALLVAQLVHELGEKKPEKVLRAFRLALETEPLMTIDAADLVDAATMGPVAKIDRSVLLAAAVKLGRTRLIDNVVFGG
jgi:pantoate--beta-alanine ligase